MPDILTDEQAAAIWSGQTSSILGLETTTTQTKTAEELAAEAKAKEDAAKAAAAATTTTTTTTTNTGGADDKSAKAKLKDEDLNSVFRDDDEEEEEDETGKTSTSTSQSTGGEGSKKGRKPTDLVQVVNQLITEDILFGYEDEKGTPLEIKTIDDAKQLIKDNLAEKAKETEESWKDEYKKSFSPQVQAILHYAEQGAQSASQIAELLGTIKQVEEVGDLDVKTPAGQEQVIRQTYKSRGFKDAYIDKQVNILKDLGGDKLKEEAEELYPELAQIRSDQVKQIMASQEKRRKDAEEASKVYVDTVKEVLNKETVGGIKLTREDKAKLYEAVTQPKYTSLNGSATNLFVKTLEDLQFGKNANYEQFMNIVQYTIDPKGFLEKIKTTVGNELTDATFRKLKTAKSNVSNTDTTDTGAQRQQANTTSTGRKTITKSGFVNPYA